MLSTQHIDTLEAFEALADEWDALVLGSHFAAPMLLHDWACCWFKTFGAAYVPAVITVRENGRLVAAAPLCRRRVCVGPAAICNELRTLGAASVAGLYFDFPVHAQASSQAIEALMTALMHEACWNRLRLERMVPGALLLEPSHLAMLFSGHGQTGEMQVATPCPVLHLPETMDDLLAGMTPIFRASLRKKTLKLAPRKHAVEFVPQVGPDTLTEDLLRFFKVHTERWRQCGHAGEFGREGHAEFYLELVPRLHAKGLLQFSKLNLDGQGHWYFLGVPLGTQFFGLQMGVSLLGLECRAGTYGLYQLMQDLLPRMTAFHFMEGGETYKFDWGASPQTAFTLQAWRGLRGHVMHYLNHFRQVLQTMPRPVAPAVRAR